MKFFAKFAMAAALLVGGLTLGTAAPAQAQVSFSVGIGGPAYYGYDYYRPCRWYFNHDYPAPRRCYRDYYGYYGRNVYLYDGFVFRDRSHWNRYRYRDDYRHWRSHDWNRRDYRHDRRVDRRHDRWEDRRDRRERRHDRREDRRDRRHDRWERHH